MTDYEQFLRDVDILACCLMGEYNSDGKYVISPETINALVESKKLITSFKEEGLTAQTQVGEYTFKFKIVLNTSKQESLKFASLYLVEEYKFLNKSNFVETFLVSYSDFDDTFYLDKLKQAFNLYSADEFDGKDISDTVACLLDLKNKKKALFKKIMDSMGDFNKTYVMDIIRQLKGMGEYGLYVQKILKGQLDKSNINRNDPKFWQSVKQMLDVIVLESRSRFPEQSKTLLDQINKTYVEGYNKAKEKAKEKPAPEVKAPKKKSDKKKAKEIEGAFVTPKDAKGKDDKKKDDKKKDAKKEDVKTKSAKDRVNLQDNSLYKPNTKCGFGTELYSKYASLNTFLYEGAKFDVAESLKKMNEHNKKIKENVDNNTVPQTQPTKDVILTFD